MAAWLEVVGFGLAGVGLAIALVQYIVLLRHLRGPIAHPSMLPPISILKPLCGVDDDLLTNLGSFAALDYPDYEVLLGVRDRGDPAFPVAVEAQSRWPDRFRVVVQRGSPGLNPKVNQLITLTASARFDVLVVSDSNVRVGPGYLAEIAACFENPSTGLVTHPVVGVGEETVGATLDNLHLSAGIGAGTVAAKVGAGKDLVVGKSMALRRQDLRALGGFETFKDVLAEDWLAGILVPRRLGKRVAIARSVVRNHTRNRTVSDFVRRYCRWSTMQRRAVGAPTYTLQLLLNPVLFATIALASDPGAFQVSGWLACCVLKSAVDVAARTALSGDSPSWRSFLSVPLKDGLIGVAWMVGMLRDEVSWRGNRLQVLEGTRLRRVEPHPRLRTRTTVVG
jgi:ceramide glucosyltransferase